MPFNNSEYRRDYLERRRASRYTLGLPQSATAEQFRKAVATAKSREAGKGPADHPARACAEAPA
jgi:hypothetical protein